MEDLAKYNLSININNCIFTIRTNELEELKKEIPEIKNIILEIGTEIREENIKLLTSTPVNIPKEISDNKPEKCPKCGNTELVFNTGVDKNGKTYFAYDCLQCKSKVGDREFNTRIFVNPDIKPKGITKLPESTKTKSNESLDDGIVQCTKCGSSLTFGIKKYCESKKIPPMCFECQQKEKNDIEFPTDK